MRVIRLLLVVGLTFLVSTAAFADDGTFQPVTLTDLEPQVTKTHTEGQTNPGEWKGWAYVIVTNNMTQEWGGFHFKLVDFALQPSVYFLQTAPYAPSASWQPYTVDFSEFSDIGTAGLVPQQIDFSFDTPVPNGQSVSFAVYTNNETDMNAWFSMCMWPTPVPEPTTIALLGFGGMLLLRRKG